MGKGTTAEQAYFFRHAIVREAAYELQTASQRAALHLLAIEAMEHFSPGDELAYELAGHAASARLAHLGVGSDVAEPLQMKEFTYLARASIYAEQRFNYERALECSRRRFALRPDVTPLDQLHRLGSLCFTTGATTEAEDAVRKALAFADSDQQRGRALATLASILRQTGKSDQAEAVYLEALQAHRQAGDTRTEGITLNNLASYYLDRCRYELALEKFNAALALHRASGNLLSEGVTLNGLGSMHLTMGQLDLAMESLSRAVTILQQIGNMKYLAVVLGNLALLHVRQGDSAQAEAHYLRSLKLAREVNDRRLEGIVLGNYGTLLRELGRISESRDHLAAAIPIHREMNNPAFEGMHLADAALSALADGEPAEAAQLWRAGAALLGRIGRTPMLEPRIAPMLKACADAGIPPLE